MIKKFYGIFLVMVVLAFSVVAASMIIPANEKAKENSNAPENSPIIDENFGLIRTDFIHYAKSEGSAKPAKVATCYKLLGVKWKSFPVNYTINPTNPHGLSEDFVTSAISTSAETWDIATSSELFNDVYNLSYNSSYGVQDFKNTIDFGDYPNDNVIAITSIWSTLRGKQIVEFDIRFNTRFNWGNAEPNKMDLQNIATHEIGHGVGLNDIYALTCSAVTMYGYSNYGEIEKRSLEPADIAGLQALY